MNDWLTCSQCGYLVEAWSIDAISKDVTCSDCEANG